MINGVSFGAISTDPTIKLQDATIIQPNNNSVAPTPTTSAAAEVKGDSFEKKGKGGKVVGVLATITAALTALALLVKYHIINPKEGEKLGLTDKAINIAHTIGNKTLEIAQSGIAKIKKLFHIGAENKAPKGDDNVLKTE